MVLEPISADGSDKVAGGLEQVARNKKAATRVRAFVTLLRRAIVLSCFCAVVGSSSRAVIPLVFLVFFLFSFFYFLLSSLYARSAFPPR